MASLISTPLLMKTSNFISLSIIPGKILRKFYKKELFIKILLMLVFVTVAFQGYSQSQKLKDYVILGGVQNCPPSMNCGVFIGPNNVIDTGVVGSYSLLQTSGNLTHGGGLYSEDEVSLSGSNTISENIYVGNTLSKSGSIFTAGSGFLLFGDLFTGGDVDINSGVIEGSVTRPPTSLYSGPSPLQGEVLTQYNFKALPAYPNVSSFPPMGNGKLASSQTISPGIYGDISLKGGKVITFQGVGDYYINSIDNKGSYNTFTFDFSSQPQGTIRLLIHGDVDLGKMKVNILNGGDASRVFMEVHGTGQSSNTGDIAFQLSPGSVGSGENSQWLGTVWAPNGAIEVGGGSDKALIRGALFSAVRVTLNNNLNIDHIPFEFCNTPFQISFSALDTVKCSKPSIVINGSSALPNVTPLWTTNDGLIISGDQSWNLEVGSGGTYLLTVSSNFGCIEVDSVYVEEVECIKPYYPPPRDGKTYDIIGSELNSLYSNTTYQDSLQYVFILKSDSVFVEIIALDGQFQTLLNLLRTTPYGLTNEIDNGPNSLIISGLFPIVNLPKLDSLPSLVNYARPLFPPISGRGVTTTEGDIAMNADYVRGGFDVGGENIKVGVISDSYNTQFGNPAGTDILNEDLPGLGNQSHPQAVSVIKEYSFGVASDEGRAMLQIVHDVAPNADLAFRTGFLSAGDMAQGIYALQADSCDVIVDDVTYITEPFLADGIIAKSVNDVRDDDIVYISSAGNFGNKSYASVFNPVPAPAGIIGEAHDFGGGDIYQNVSLIPGNYTIVLQWQDSIYSLGQTSTGTNNDIDIYLTDDFGNTLFGFNRNNLFGDPIEILPFTVTDTTESNILIVRAAGSQNVPFKYIVFRGEMSINEYQTGQSTIVGHANAEGAITVGAVYYGYTPEFGFPSPTIESFSSKGGNPVNGFLRNKPDLCAPDGVNTTVNLGYDIENDGYSNFFGTSAAAPHVAGVAALLQSAKVKFEGNKISPESVRQILTSTSIDMYGQGYDEVSGNGLIQANQALLSFANPYPVLKQISVIDSILVPGQDSLTVLVEGEYFTPNTLVLLRDDTLSTTILDATHIEAEVPLFNGNPPIRAFNPALTSSQLDGGYSDTLLFFAPIKQDVLVIANRHTKRYSELNPPLTFKVLVDSIPYDSAGYTLKDLGLDSLNVFTTASELSDVGIYLVRAERPRLNLNDPFETGLNEVFNFEYIDGDLTIKKMPLTISAKDTILEYGSPLGNFQFTYDFPDSLVNPAQLNNIINGVSSGHTQNISKGLALINGSKLVQGRALVNGDLEKMTFVASGKALVNGRTLLKGYPLVNGGVAYDTTIIVDVALKSLYDYQVDSKSASLIKGYPLVNSRALIEGLALVNSTAFIEGYPLVNSYPLVRGYPLVNGYPIVNNQAVNLDSNDLVVIIDEADVNSTSSDTTLDFSPINLITGTNVGTHIIVPAAYFNPNYNVNYQLGALTITPATLTLAVDSLSYVYGDSVVYNYSTSGYQYQEDASSIIKNPPVYSIYDTDSNLVLNKNLDAGSYIIIPDSLDLGDSSNYIADYQNGWLDISPADLFVYSDTLLSTTYGTSYNIPLYYNGFRYDDNKNNNVLTAPVFSILDSSGSQYLSSELNAGSYQLILDSLELSNSANYYVSYDTIQLQVNKAMLYVQPRDTSRVYGEVNPTFVLEYSGFKYSDSEFEISAPSASCTAFQSSFVGSYPVVLTGGAASNYDLNLLAGTLEILPSAVTIKANDDYIYRGDTLPNITYILIGILNLTDSLITEPMFSIDPAYSTTAGVYNIIPSNAQISNGGNYVISYQNGSLYVNPKGRAAKNVKPSLECVDTLYGNSSGLNFIAHYSYENKNNTPVYIPRGTDNNLDNQGPISGSQPEVFNPGVNYFDIYFDGSKLTWTVTTYRGNQKTSTASDASSTSNKCNSNGNKKELEVVDLEWILFPNPAEDWIEIKHPQWDEGGEVIIYNANGRIIKLKDHPVSEEGSVKINLTGLSSGLYLIQLKKDSFKGSLKVIKE